MFEILVLSVTIFLFIYGYFKWTFKYWERKGVKTPTPYFPFGNISSSVFGLRRFDAILHDHFNQLKVQDVRFGGIYFMCQKFFVPIDLDLIKNILLKDFGHFVNHGFYVDEEADPLTGNLLALEDEPWRILRQKLTPTFTSGKMKMMFQTINNCSSNLRDLIKKNIEKSETINIRETLLCYTIDVIGLCAFGVDFKTMENPENDFRKYGKMATELSFSDLLKNLAVFALPKSLLKKFKFSLNNPEMTRFFLDVVHDTVSFRQEHDIKGKDFLQLLIDLKNSESKATLTENRLAAQAFIFYIGGFETSSTAMTFALLELALNPLIQKKLRNEIRTNLTKNNNQISYDSLAEMKYLDQVVSETLRKYPPFGALFRKCNKTYKVPDSDLTIEEGTGVVISVLGVHYNHEYYPNPEVFDPDRFTEENKASRPSFTWLPFSEGPRNCIGMRFGIMQTKMGLISILRDYEVSVNKKTIIPLQLEPTSLTPTATGGVWLDLFSLK